MAACLALALEYGLPHFHERCRTFFVDNTPQLARLADQSKQKVIIQLAAAPAQDVADLMFRMIEKSSRSGYVAPAQRQQLWAGAAAGQQALFFRCTCTHLDCVSQRA